MTTRRARRVDEVQGAHVEEVLRRLYDGGFRFFPQKGKRRVVGENLDLDGALDHLAQARENTLGLEAPANFIALDLDDLKTSQTVIDRAKPFNALMIIDWTPRGAHIIFEVDPQELLDAKPFKSGRTIYGEPAELFSPGTNARVTFYGRHLEIGNGGPLKDLARFLPVLSQRTFQQPDRKGMPVVGPILSTPQTRISWVFRL